MALDLKKRHSLADPVLGPQLKRCLQAGQRGARHLEQIHSLTCAGPTCAEPKILYVPETEV